MKLTILAVCFALALSSCSRANSVVIIDITTTEAATTYALNNQRKTPDEIEAWLREAIKTFGDKDPVLIRPDKQTSFETVLDMIRRFKAAGVKHFQVFTVRVGDGDTRIQDSISGITDSIQSDSFTLPSPPRLPPQ